MGIWLFWPIFYLEIENYEDFFSCGIIKYMRLPRNFDKVLALVAVVVLTLLFGGLIKFYSYNTFATGDTVAFSTEGAKFVSFYDEGQKLGIAERARSRIEHFLLRPFGFRHFLDLHFYSFPEHTRL